MLESEYPVNPPRFVALPSPTRSRILLVARAQDPAPSATQVATVPLSVDVMALVAALNTAAWTGDHTELNGLKGQLPDPVWESCVQALKTVPPARTIAVGDEGIPLAVAKTVYMSLESADLDQWVDAALTLDVQLIVENVVDDDGDILLRLELLAGAPDFETAHDGTWWALDDAVTVIERVALTSRNLSEETEDTRWDTQRVRAYTAWAPESDSDEDDIRTGTVFVEYLSAPLTPAVTFDDTEDLELGPLTLRNRFVLWNALSEISGSIAMAFDGDTFDGGDSMVYADMPRITHQQPAGWWRQLQQAANVLAEAARVGDYDRLIPQTPAEEALIALATRNDYVALAQDTIADGYQSIYDALPENERDGEFNEILPDLTGDTDIEMLWMPRLDGIEDPISEENQDLGIGDYRPEAWHTPFDGRVHLGE